MVYFLGLAIALGREQIGERWNRWIQVSERYGSRIAQGGELAAIDLRYANGFAARITGLPADEPGKGRGATGQKKAQTSEPARTPASAAAHKKVT